MCTLIIPYSCSLGYCFSFWTQRIFSRMPWATYTTAFGVHTQPLRFLRQHKVLQYKGVYEKRGVFRYSTMGPLLICRAAQSHGAMFTILTHGLSAREWAWTHRVQTEIITSHENPSALCITYTSWLKKFADAGIRLESAMYALWVPSLQMFQAAMLFATPARSELFRANTKVDVICLLAHQQPSSLALDFTLRCFSLPLFLSSLSPFFLRRSDRSSLN